MAVAKSTSLLTVTMDDLGSGWQISKIKHVDGREWLYAAAPFFRVQIWDTVGASLTQAVQSNFNRVTLDSVSETAWQLNCSDYSGISGLDLTVTIGLRLDGAKLRVSRPKATHTSDRYAVQSAVAPLTLVTPTQTATVTDEALVLPLNEGALVFDPAHVTPALFTETSSADWSDGTDQNVWTIGSEAGKVDGLYWLDRAMTMQCAGYFNRTSGEGLFYQTTCPSPRQVAWGFDPRSSTFMIGVKHFPTTGMREPGSVVDCDYDVVIEPFTSGGQWAIADRYRAWVEETRPSWLAGVQKMASGLSEVSDDFRAAQYAHVQVPTTGSDASHAANDDRTTEAKTDINALATALSHTNLIALIYHWQTEVTGGAISWPDLTKHTNLNTQLALMTPPVGLYTTPLKTGTENTTTLPELQADAQETDSAGAVVAAANPVWGSAPGDTASVDPSKLLHREIALDQMDALLRASGAVNVSGIYCDTWPDYDGPNWNPAQVTGGPDRLTGAREFLKAVRAKYRQEKADFWVVTEFPTEHMVGAADAAFCGITQITNTSFIDGSGTKGASWPQLWSAVYGEYLYLFPGEGVPLRDPDDTDVLTSTQGLAQVRLAMSAGALPGSIARFQNNNASHALIGAGLGTNGQAIFDALEEFTDWLAPATLQRIRDYYLEGRAVKPPATDATADFATRFWGANGWYPGLLAAIADTDVTVGAFTCEERGGLCFFIQNGTGAEITDLAVSLTLTDYPFLPTTGLTIYSIASNGTRTSLGTITAGATSASFDIASIAADVTAWIEINDH